MVELTTILNIISTIALIGALAFTGLQVRTANRVRAEQAALSIIHAIQTDEWAHNLNSLIRIPSGATAAQIDALGPEIMRMQRGGGGRGSIRTESALGSRTVCI